MPDICKPDHMTSYEITCISKLVIIFKKTYLWFLM